MLVIPSGSMCLCVALRCLHNYCVELQFWQFFLHEQTFLNSCKFFESRDKKVRYQKNIRVNFCKIYSLLIVRPRFSIKFCNYKTRSSKKEVRVTFC